MSVISASAESASDITVAIDTGAEVTLKDTDADNYYEIGTADELYAFAYAVNAGNYSINGELTANIVVNEGTMTAETDSTTVRHWTPIAKGGYHAPYKGHFYGADYTISGLYFNDSDRNFAGLIGALGTDGLVDYVSVTNSYFNSGAYIGGIVGYNVSGTIKYCTNTGTINGNTTLVGGIAGRNDATIEYCTNTGTVNGSIANVGGVVGYNYTTGTLKNSYNTGNVSGIEYIGDVVGYNTGTLETSYNTGDISGTVKYIGGIAGCNVGTLKNSYNTGNVSGDSNSTAVGGVVGYNQIGTVTNSINIGNVSGTDNYIGDVVGKNIDATITSCYYLANSETDEFGGTTFKTKAQFESGEVAYLLQEGVAEDEYGNKPYVWGQIIGTDDSPIFTDYHTVYSGKNCKGEVAYTNIDTEYYEVTLHSNFDDDGFCTDCENGYKKPAVEIGEDGWSMVYLISNAGELFWLQDSVNSGVAGDCHA